MASRKFRSAWTPTLPLSPDEIRRPPRPPAIAPPTGWRREVALALFVLRWSLREALRWMLALLGRKKERPAAVAQEARAFAERMGGMWIILAHLASLGEELWGRSFCRELRGTRDRACVVPSAQIRQIIDEELRTQGTCFADAFSEFDDTPMSTKSFSQVHIARLKQTGHRVTVRVRPPGAEQRAASDWRFMRIVAFLLKKVGLAQSLLADDLLFEVKLAADDLLDLRTEVTELKRIRRILSKQRIYVPLIFSALSTERVLMIEYIQGVSIATIKQLSDIDPDRCDKWFRENNIKRGRVWQRIFNMHHELLFEHSLFYTELFAKNILLLKNGRIALVDFGAIGSIDAELKRKYINFCRAVLEHDFSKAAEAYLAMGPALPYQDLMGMKLSVGRALRNWEFRSYIKRHMYHEKSLGAAAGVVAQCARAQGLPKLWNLARLQKAEDILGDSLSVLDRTKNGITALRRYEYDAQKRAVAASLSNKKSKNRIGNLFDMAQLNMQLVENLEHDGKYLRQRLLGFQGRIGRAAKVLGHLLRITSAVVLLVLGIEIFTFIKNRYMAAIPGVDQGPVGRIFTSLRVDNKGLWVAVIIGLFYFRRFLAGLARQLFAKEIRPGDVV